MTYIQYECVAMGAPTSSISSNIYLQYLENSRTFNLLLDHNIEGYSRYVDDKSIVYNKNKTNIDKLLDHFYNLTAD